MSFGELGIYLTKLIAFNFVGTRILLYVITT
jgi:hypothetical protein